ncbi:MAG: flavodoxin family protein [Deltaproteobacteria bacterium]|jgi:multimeric flavodoxin WrbA|nr:flavodoxin family protein [Deltaproteobacteria bacterium]
MKVATILGSPRRDSASTVIAEKVVTGLGPGVSEKKFVLNEMNVRGCQGCGSCKGKTETCVLTDDMIKVLGAAADCDLLILTSPIYIGEITGQAKLFVDRTYSWFKPDFILNAHASRLAPGKKAILLFTQGNPEKDFYLKTVHANYAAYFGNHGFKVLDHPAHVPADPKGAAEAVGAHARDILDRLVTL